MTVAPGSAMRLRKIVHRFVLVALPAIVGCDGNLYSPDSCVENVEKTFVVLTPADPPLTLRIETCRIDADACPDLCQIVMDRAGLSQTQNGLQEGDGAPPGGPIGPPGHSFTACGATFEGDKVSVSVTYSKQNTGSNCAVPFATAGTGTK